MSFTEALVLAPNVIQFQTQQKYYKSYRQIYTEARDEIFDQILHFIGTQIIVEKVSQDEVFLDITEICKQHKRVNITYPHIRDVLKT